MEKGDIGVTMHARVACWFENLLVNVHEKPEPGKLSRFFKKDVKKDSDDWARDIVRSWSVNEQPMRSIIHLREQLGINVDVYTYYDEWMVEHIEHYLARKGAHAQVWSYPNVEELKDDLKYNREVHTLFTPYEEDARIIGWQRATVVNTEGKFGF